MQKRVHISPKACSEIRVQQRTDYQVHVALTKIERRKIEIVNNKELWSFFKHSKDIEEVDKAVKEGRDMVENSDNSLDSISPDDIISKCNYQLS